MTPATLTATGPSGLRVRLPEAETTVHLIEDQARRRPHDVALVYDGTTMSYSELDGKANTLARLLLDHGAGSLPLLPLLVDDGMELPVAIVAAMKAAIPFVSMDPGWPAERINTLVGEVGADLVVGSPRTPPAVADGRRTLVVDHAALPTTADLPPRRPRRADLAYGFFTSGTTGTPKCTLNVHRGLLNRFTFMTRRFGAGHVSLQNSRSTFDSSLWQLLWPLTMGGSVVMPRRHDLLDLERTVEQIGCNRVTITDFVPSIFTVLVDLLAADPRLVRTASTLRHVLLGGEAINVDAVRRFHGLLPDVRVTNTYGPTEASIGSVFYTIAGAPGCEIPLGRPIDNTAAIVVDAELRAARPGQTGEVLIGGDCLGAGYLNDPTRTDAAFIPNPFPDVPGDRLYRTGDLAQYRGNGQLYFVGRRDDQLKVRGVRIEPADLERSLATLPGVLDVKVLTIGENDQTALIAAVVAEDGFDPADARNRARRLLPAEFLPDRFVAVEGLPLSANGKADRPALARVVEGLVAGKADAELAGAGPLDEREQLLQTLWTEVVGGSPAGPEADFFDVGGTSLNAHRLALRIQEQFGVRLPVRDITQAPTIRAQARLVAGDSASAYDAEGVERQMLADARLPAWFHVEGAPAKSAPGHILLTGATGFIGTHLLDEMLRATGATVTCLVNADDEVAARARLDGRAQSYRVRFGAAAQRIRVLRGDLAAERFGLDDADFLRLAAEVDTVVHAGAEVNLVHSYRRLRPVNVGGTLEVLRFAVSGGLKPIHHVSTLGVLPRRADGLDEQTFPSEHAVPAEGYDQTKWVAEALLRAARDEGVPVSVYRLGEVMPHSRSGVFSQGGSLAEFIIEACVELGVRITTGVSSDFTPVDNVCRFIAAAVGQRQLGGCFHVVQPEPARLDDILEQFGRDFALEPVDYPEFHARVTARAFHSPDAGVFARLLAVLPESDPPADLGSLFRHIPEAGFSDRCRTVSGQLDLHWIPIDAEVFQHYARSFRDK